MKRVGIIAGAIFLAAIPALATELVYQPVNPSFGGYVGNGRYLLDQAEVQNKFKEKIPKKEPLETFKETLDRRILTYLTTKVLESKFGGTSEITPGQYEVGDYSIDISAGSDGELTVNITDKQTGYTTSITIPATL